MYRSIGRRILYALVFVTPLIAVEPTQEQVDKEPIAFLEHFKKAQERRDREQLSDEELLAQEGGAEEADLEELYRQRAIKKANGSDEQERVSCAMQLFYTSNEEAYQHLHEVVPLGDQLVLWDRSRWTVNPDQAYLCKKWQKGAEVVVLPNRPWLFRSPYKFRIQNVALGESVEVNMALSAHVDSHLFHYLTYVDYRNGRVVLNDGSVWSVPLNDTDLLAEWCAEPHERHIIMIGMNDSWFSFKPNILINVSRYSYLPARCIGSQ